METYTTLEHAETLLKTQNSSLDRGEYMPRYSRQPGDADDLYWKGKKSEGYTTAVGLVQQLNTSYQRAMESHEVIEIGQHELYRDKQGEQIYIGGNGRERDNFFAAAELLHRALGLPGVTVTTELVEEQAVGKISELISASSFQETRLNAEILDDMGYKAIPTNVDSLYMLYTPSGLIRGNYYASQFLIIPRQISEE